MKLLCEGPLWGWCPPLSNQCEMQSENGTKDIARTMQLTMGEQVTGPLNRSFHCTDLKLIFPSCLIPFVLKKKKRKKEKLKRIFFWPSTNKCNVANNACVASPHCSHITAPRSLLRAENPVTTQLAGNTTGNITAKYLLICSHQTGALNRCHCYSQSQAGLGCVFVFILFCSRSQSVKVTFHKCIKHHNIPASSGVYYELSKAWCSLSLFFFFKLHLSRR